ncbi:MAG: ATP-binding protein [Capsulimonadaceae bacterium]|nr:ATP-binding protein [Capsulimonadaceae bacterium]
MDILLHHRQGLSYREIFFMTMADLVEKLRADEAAGKTGRSRSHYKAALVVVDEVGYTPIAQEECHLFYRFVANRYEKASTVITSNKAFSDWSELFHDPVIVTAILDRLLHHSVVVNIKGNNASTCSYGPPANFISTRIIHNSLSLRPSSYGAPIVL